MAGHWADPYVGLPGNGKRPCWLLVRQVWIDRMGFVMPRFDEEDDPEAAFAREAVAFQAVATGQEQAMDAVLMAVPVKTAAGFRPAEKHIGVVVSKGLVLHVQENTLSCIEPLAGLHVSRLLRGPWGLA